MKKGLCYLMSLILFIACFSGMNLTVSAATTEIAGAESKEKAISINYDVEYGVSLPAEGTQWFKFTTKDNENYWYNLSIENISVGNHNGFAGVNATVYDSFGEKFVFTSHFSGAAGTDGSKLEASTTYYIAIYGVRKGNIKFCLTADEDVYSETKDNAVEIELGKIYESSIDSCGGTTDDRTEDGKSADVDYVKFNTGKCSKIKLTLYNSDVDYYNTYFEGVAGKIVDEFGSSYSYIEVRPDSNEEIIVNLEKDTTYYIKFFSTSGGAGKYKFIVEYAHESSDWIIDSQGSCDKDGAKHKECTICYEVLETETISATGHNYIDGKCTICDSADPDSVVQYDANGDGKVSAVDARYVLQYVAGLKSLTETQLSAADANNDNSVTAVDARIILQKVAGII